MFSVTIFWLVILLAYKGVSCDEKNLNVEVEHSVAIPCSVADASLETDSFSVVWLVKYASSRSSEWTNLGNTEYGTAKILSEDVSILDNLTLSFGRVGLNDSGLYMCLFTNASEVNETTHDQIQLTVYENPVPVVGKPDIDVFGPTTVSVKWDPIEYEDKVLYAVEVRDRAGKMLVVDASDGEAQYQFDDLVPYTDYQFRVLATNALGQQSYGSASDWVRTAEDAPSGKIKVIGSKSFSNFLAIDFELPSSNEWNGNLTGFIVLYSVTGSDVNITKEFAVVGINAKQQTLNVSHLMPYTSYDIKIAVFNRAGTGPFSELITLRTEEGVPSKPRSLNITTRNDTMLIVRWEEPEIINGRLLGYNLFWSSNSSRDWLKLKSVQTASEITGLTPYTEYGIQVSAFTKIGSGPKSDVHHAVTDTAAPGVPTLVNVSINQSDSVIVRWWRPQNFTKQIDAYFLRYRPHGEVFFYQLNFKQMDMMQDFFEVPVTHLIPNEIYEFQVAAVTKSLFSEHEYVGRYSEPQLFAVTDTTLSETGRTDPTDEDRKANLLTLGVISGVLCCLLILGGLTVFIISRHLLRRRYQFIADQDGGKQPTAALLLSDIYDPKSCYKESVPVEKFQDHVAALHADGDYSLSQEYEEINQMTPSDSSTSQSCEEENKQKNRYLNILAYDHSRVVLSQLPGKPKQSDYINANFVNGYKRAKAFIATQGPLPSTFGDFWRMVWEQESSVIVMITNLTEKGRRKCDQYWPNEGEHQYDSITVRLINTRVKAHYTVRTFVIKHLRHKKSTCCFL